MKGTEITSVIQQWKEMNCEAGSINTMDQGRERDTRAAKEFWKNLGGKSPVKGNFVALIQLVSIFTKRFVYLRREPALLGEILRWHSLVM